jgi:hypothetical protein
LLRVAKMNQPLLTHSLTNHPLATGFCAALNRISLNTHHFDLLRRSSVQVAQGKLNSQQVSAPPSYHNSQRGLNPHFLFHEPDLDPIPAQTGSSYIASSVFWWIYDKEPWSIKRQITLSSPSSPPPTTRAHSWPKPSRASQPCGRLQHRNHTNP